MQLHQLKYILEVYRSGNHMSAAAEALHTSQPGISKQIRMLELELCFDIVERTRNRIVGTTEPGREVIKFAEAIFSSVADIKKIGSDYNDESGKKLTIATTHTFARYALPRAVKVFLEKCPTIQLGLMQGNPTEVCEYVQAGHADFAVATASMKAFIGLVHLPCFTVTRSVIAKKGHPLLTLKTIGLKDLVNYPIISHDGFRSGGWAIRETFVKAGLKPTIPFSGVDSDVAKTYVELGLGIAIMASIAADPLHDGDLMARDVSHLFSSSVAYVSFRKSAYLRKMDMDFINILSPELTRLRILAAREAPAQGTHDKESVQV
jgi:LysR family transcriptional regulator, cys regulon transcriptional activator